MKKAKPTSEVHVNKFVTEKNLTPPDDKYNKSFRVTCEIGCDSAASAQETFEKLMEIITDAKYYEDTHPDLIFTQADGSDKPLKFLEGVEYIARHKVLEPKEGSKFKVTGFLKAEKEFHMTIEQLDPPGKDALFQNIKRMFTMAVGKDNTVTIWETASYKIRTGPSFMVPDSIPVTVMSNSHHREARLVTNPESFVTERSIRDALKNMTVEEKAGHMFGKKVSYHVPLSAIETRKLITERFDKLHPRVVKHAEAKEEKQGPLVKGSEREIGLLFPMMKTATLEATVVDDKQITLQSTKVTSGSFFSLLKGLSIWYKLEEPEVGKTHLTIKAAYTLTTGLNAIIKKATSVNVEQQAAEQFAQENILEFFTGKMLTTIMRKVCEEAEQIKAQAAAVQADVEPAMVVNMNV